MVGSTFYCPECGLKMTIPRKRAKLRENNHIKHMYCINCDKAQGFIEKTVDKQVDFWDKFQTDYCLQRRQ